MQSYIIALLAFLLSSVEGQATGPIFSKSAATGQCLKFLGEDIGVTLGTGAHTIQVQLTFPETAPTNHRQWILNLGQRSSDAHHWIWNSRTFAQIGGWNGVQIQKVDISKCSDLTTTYSGSVLKLYCDGVYMAEVNTYLNIRNAQLDVGRPVSEAHFAGCISKVTIWSVEKSAEEVAKHRKDECGLHQHSVCTSYPCIDLREGKDHHHIMILDHSDKTKAKITYYNRNWQSQAGASWDCSRITADGSLVGTWNCGDFYKTGIISISADYADDFTVLRTNDSIDFCAEDGALTQDCRWESTHDPCPDNSDYMGWTCADDEILTGFRLSPNQHDVTQIQCCKLGGFSAVKSGTCSFENSNHESAECGDGTDHKVFSGAYDMRAPGSTVDAVTEILAGKCCEVECDAPWCAGGDWGVDKNNCQVISTQSNGGQDLVCPTGTLLTEIQDGLAGNAHGVQKVASVTCCALDLISQPTMAPSAAPTTSKPTSFPTSAPVTSAPSAAPTTVTQCLLSQRDTRLTEAQFLQGIDDCLPGCLSIPHRRALDSRLLTEDNRRQ